jgi:hypothetical protein
VLQLRKWLQAAGVSISAGHPNLRSRINVSKQFDAGWAQKRTRKSYAGSVAATLARGYPKEQRGDLAARKGPNLINHKMYKDLYKHQAFVLMQIRIECVGMADFLFHRYVSDVPTPLYSCGEALETLEHVLLYCTKIAEKKKIMRQ